MNELLKQNHRTHIVSVEPARFRIWVELGQDDDEAGYGIRAVNLPGVYSQGDTADEALVNIVEAAQGVIHSYKELHKEIPWTILDNDMMENYQEVIVDG